jgi:hypothetical protein
MHFARIITCIGELFEIPGPPLGGFSVQTARGGAAWVLVGLFFGTPFSIRKAFDRHSDSHESATHHQRR